MSSSLRKLVVQGAILALAMCLVLVVLVLPRQLSRPVLYRSTIVIQIDETRYKELFDASGQVDADFESVVDQAKRVFVARYPGFGSAELYVSFSQLDRTHVQATLYATSPTIASKLVTEFADVMVLTIRAAGGREILRNLLAWELSYAIEGNPPVDEATAALRVFLQRGVFVFQKPLEPSSAYVSISQLNSDDKYDLMRAVDYRGIELSDIEIPQQTDESKLRTLIPMLDAVKHFSNVMLRTSSDLQFRPSQPSAVWRDAQSPAELVSNSRNLVNLSVLIVAISIIGSFLLMLFIRRVKVLDRMIELWHYRELLVFMVQRILNLRYSKSVLGFAWTQIIPVSQLAVYWVVFGRLIQVGDIPMYVLFIACGLIPWNLSAEAIHSAVNSVRDNANIIRSVYFPRELIPLASIFANVMNFVFSIPVLILLVVVSRYVAYGTISVPLTIAYFPIILFVQIVFLVGIGLFFSAMSLYWRDTSHFVGILLHFWFFLNPIFYSFANINPLVARVLRWINPLASIIEFYREILYGVHSAGQIPTPGIPATESVLRVLVTGIILCIGGYWLFRNVHDTVSERI